MSFLHRAGQYFSAIRAELFGVGGADYIARYLSDDEQQLWRRQKAPDMAHSLNVARTADRLQKDEVGSNLSPDERLILLKAALLHDIGRGRFGSSFAKSLAVLLTIGRTPAVDNKKPDAQGRPEAMQDFNTGSYRENLLYHYYCHPQIGGKLLRELYSRDGGQLSRQQERIIRLVEHHRDADAGDDRLLQLLIEADRRN